MSSTDPLAIAPSRAVVYPRGLDAFMPLMDGWTPIVPADLNDLQFAISVIQAKLGAGPSTYESLTSPGDYYGVGVKGTNDSLKQRLDTFLERDGRLRQIVLVTGETAVHHFDEAGFGVPVIFGRKIQGASVSDAGGSYAVLFQAYSTARKDDRVNIDVPAFWWVGQRSEDFCTIHARGLEGQRLAPVRENTVHWACLVIGAAACPSLNLP